MTDHPASMCIGHQIWILRDHIYGMFDFLTFTSVFIEACFKRRCRETDSDKTVFHETPPILRILSSYMR